MCWRRGRRSGSRGRASGASTHPPGDQVAPPERELTPADVSRIETQRDAAQVGLAEAEEMLREAMRSLGLLLTTARPGRGLELRGSMRYRAPPPPPADELIRLALEARPDLVAFRLGVQSPSLTCGLAQATGFRTSTCWPSRTRSRTIPLRPSPQECADSWALGLTVPLPIYDRNQGRIQRAQINVRQTQIELATLEQQVATEVRQSECRYAMTRASALRIQRDLLPMAAHLRDAAPRRYRGGETPIVDFLNARP